MSGFSSEERAAPFTLEYRVFLSEWWRRAARPPIHSRSLGASGRAGGGAGEGRHPSAHRDRSLHISDRGPRGKENH